MAARSSADSAASPVSSSSTSGSGGAPDLAAIERLILAQQQQISQLAAAINAQTAALRAQGIAVPDAGTVTIGNQLPSAAHTAVTVAAGGTGSAGVTAQAAPMPQQQQQQAIVPYDKLSAEKPQGAYVLVPASALSGGIPGPAAFAGAAPAYGPYGPYPPHPQQQYYGPPPPYPYYMQQPPYPMIAGGYYDDRSFTQGMAATGLGLGALGLGLAIGALIL